MSHYHAVAEAVDSARCKSALLREVMKNRESGRPYKIIVTINGHDMREDNLTWRQACLAVLSYGAKVKGPISARIESISGTVIP